MATINFTDANSEINYDSDVYVTVTAVNVFGSGSTSGVEMAEIGELLYYVHMCIYTYVHV